MRAGRHWARAGWRQLSRLGLLAGLLAGTGSQVSEAQVTPVAPASSAQPGQQGVAPVPAVVADTTRARPAPVVVPDAAEPDPRLTRRVAGRIGGAVGLIILTTLLLYNVRSR